MRVESYQSIFFVATSLWAALVVYLAYLHRTLGDLEKRINRLEKR
ncbi:MAG: CcmD family protein [Euryarchaeota archaeon]|nr:CcmD family protein [Euryarchaeota archaeon]